MVEITNQQLKSTAVSAIGLGAVASLSIFAGIPLPNTLNEITWVMIAVLFARAFGKKLDQRIQSTQKYKKLGIWGQFIVSGLLNFLHHFWMGLLIMLAYPQTLTWDIALIGGGLLKIPPYWIGWGIFFDDAPDIPKRFGKMFEYLYPAKASSTG